MNFNINPKEILLQNENIELPYAISLNQPFSDILNC